MTNKQIFSTSDAATYCDLTLRGFQRHIYEVKDVRGEIKGNALIFHRSELDRFKAGEALSTYEPVENVFSTKEAAKYLGMKIPSLNHQIHNTKAIKGEIVGNSLYFTREELDRFQANRRKPGQRKPRATRAQVVKLTKAVDKLLNALHDELYILDPIVEATIKANQAVKDAHNE